MNAYRFPDKSRVRLKDGIDPSFYNGLAKVGNEGIIAAHRYDKLGYPEAYIQWDKEHWAYNHQPDCWTYEGHFELVRSSMEDKEKREMFQQAMSNFADQMAKLIDVAGEPTHKPGHDTLEDDEPPFENREDRFKAQLKSAIENLSANNVESFVVTTVHRNPHPEAPQGELRSAVVHDSLSPEAELANGVQLSALGAQFHEAAAILQLYTISEKKRLDHGQTE